MKKIFTLIAVLAATLSLNAQKWDGTTPAANADYTFSGGDGSEATPYLIANGADLAQLAANVNGGTVYEGKFFQQTADIDISADEWPTIGTANAKSFQGVFDGQKKTICGLKITKSANFTGLFGFTKNATIKNVVLKDVNCDVNVTTTMCALGAVAGDAMGTVIDGCEAYGEIKMNLATGSKSGYAGGIAGMEAKGTASGTTTNNKSYVNITCSADITPTMFYAAGIAAQANGNVEGNHYEGKIVFTPATAAKCFASAIAANSNGTPTYANNTYSLAAGSTEGLFGIGTTENDGAKAVEATAIETAIQQSVRSAEMFNVNGMKVNSNYRGIVIRNGKKYYNR